jgi:quercetin dioxygenase-like cupin family protein
MDVRSIEQATPEGVHQNTVANWWLFKPRELKSETLGGYLEHVDEFVVAGGSEVHPHHHHTWEFYYVLSGRGMMTVDGASREVAQGDLVSIPPDAIHSLKPISDNAPIRCLAFAIGLKDTPEVDYVAE